MRNPMDTRHEIDLLIAAWRDGELSPEDEARAEEALRRDPALVARARDQELMGALLRESLELQMEEVDFTGFADSVLEKVEIAPKKPPFWAGIGVSLSEFLTYRRWQVLSSAALAVLLLIAGPLVWESVRPPADIGPLFAGGPADVISLATSEHTDAMLFQTSSGTTVIYLQESP